MTGNHDVISAFLDDETFDAGELTAALADPNGRELLIDLIALRHVVQTDGADTRTSIDRAPRMRGVVLRFAAVAAVLVALAGGYVAGMRRGQAETAMAPAPTRVVPPSAGWQDVRVGRLR